MNITIEKDGVLKSVKERFLQNFLDRGWKVVGEKKVSRIGKAKATADVIEEDVSPQEEEQSSMPNDNEGEE